MGFKRWTKSEDQLRPDPRFNSKLVSKFINCMMHAGKKTVSQKIMYDAMEAAAKRVGDRPALEVFEKAIQNVRPSVQIRSKRVGGSNYQVPMAVNPKRSQALAIRWIIEAARAKKGRPMKDRLASELLDAFNGQGAAVNTRENVHRMADANKAFAHFAW
ncbi:MAG: 30S ribosomal protein S7 [Phycisphaerales bacterium]|nr:30S ribosomal protein S7 [Phycisphaerales bacterium]MCB9854789.1 30S ribosomal protein S7 [Phycisphaerales bacterium]MCB9863739.1 30S ribosomal protein S7 [Phycisphaerales bacterium]